MSSKLPCRPVLAARVAVIVAGLLLLTAPAASGAELERGNSAALNGKRPKICLALSGGGARGAAHIGVLKVLEELRVPIDCIAGTSMGALVGGAYASGMDVAEMDVFTTRITTALLFKEKPPREERSMRRKEDDYWSYITPDLGVSKEGISFGKGLVSGVSLESQLRELARVKGYVHFDELPIQYRAIATDLVTGKAVIFKNGELANVMRASMSVPGAIAPTEYEDMVLVDGMLTQNLPVETALAMGADVIIAVNVGTPLLRRDQLKGILSVTNQMLSILTEQNVQTSLAKLRPSDVLITPELDEFTTGDFDRLAEIAPRGDAAARKAMEQLTRLSLSETEYRALRKRQQVKPTPDLRPVDEIRFTQLRRVNPVAARAAMDTEPGEPIDQPTLDRDMRRIYGMGYFEHVNYSFIEEQGRRILVVNAVEKTWGLDYLRFGLGLSSDLSGHAYFNLIGSYRKTWINPLGAEWRTTVQLGRPSGFGTEFYQPLRAQGDFFIAPRLTLQRRLEDVFLGDQSVASYEIRSALAGVDLGAAFGRYGEVRLGVVRGALKATLDTGSPILKPTDTDVAQGAGILRVMFDQLDSVHFPRHGWRAGGRIFASSTQLGAADSYNKWDVDGTFVHSFGDHTLGLTWKFGGKLGDSALPAYDLFQWGGFLQQSGYSNGQLLGARLTYGRVLYYHRILPGTLFEGAFGGVSLEAGQMEEPLVPGSPTGLLLSGALFAATDTPLGPVYFGYGRAKDGNSSWYLFLGRPF